MEAEKWKTRIVSACSEAGTYKPFFEDIIETLSVILEKRDEAIELYNSTNAKPVVVQTNKAQKKYMAKNPLLVIWADLNATALQYWRDLGLTPAGLRKINEDAIMTKKTSVLSKALKDLGG